MPSTITLPEKPVALQGIGGVGYSAVDLRRLVAVVGAVSQEGVLALLAATDFKITPGAGLTLASAIGEAAVQGDSIAQQARYYVRDNAGQAGITLQTPPDVTSPRVDQVVLEVKDDQHDASGLNEARIRVVSGTATGGATLDNRSGAAALPSSCMRLCDLLVPTGFAGPFVAGTHIRDRRPWARGARRRITRTTNAGGGSDYGAPLTTTRTAVLDAVNLAPRIECAGGDLSVRLRSQVQHDTLNEWVQCRPLVDGTVPSEVGISTGDNAQRILSRAGFPDALDVRWEFVPAVGSHVVALHAGQPGAGNGKLLANVNSPLTYIVEETMRQNADNNG